MSWGSAASRREKERDKWGKRAQICENAVLKQGSIILQGFDFIWGVDVTGVCAPSD